MKHRIVFVDDEPNFLAGLSRALYRQRGEWEMVFTVGAARALQEMAQTPPDVIVSDLMMPEMDGFMFLSAVRTREETKDVPMIMLTGGGQSDLKRRALDLGATDLLNKPIEAVDLVARIRNALRLKSYQDETESLNAGLERRVEERTEELERSRLEVVWRLARAGEYRDAGTGNHIVRVGCYCRALATGLGMPHDFVARIALTSPLHDIGKIGIPDRVLLKPGALTPDERKVMESHCEIGAGMLLEDPSAVGSFRWWREEREYAERASGDNGLVQTAATIALTHHERWDGTGYPAGLSGEDTPVESRIVAVADVYDALCTRRPYKPAYPEAEVIALMREQAGRQFRPDSVRRIRGTDR